MRTKKMLVFCAAMMWTSLSLAEWYQGGTLHRSTGKEWKTATAQNRLATASDFAAKVAKPTSMQDLLVKASGLERCISEAVAERSGDQQETSSVAAACVILLGYAE